MTRRDSRGSVSPAPLFGCPHTCWGTGEGVRVDLYEYQAKHLFKAHGIPGTPGEVCTTADAARETARKIGSQVVVKAQVKTGGRGKAGGVKLAETPTRRPRRPQRSSGWTSRATPSTRCSSPRRATSTPSTTCPSCSTVPTGRSWRWPASRAAWRSRRSPLLPEALAKIRVDALEGCTPQKGPGGRRRRRVPGGGQGPGQWRSCSSCGGCSSTRTRRSSRSTR